MVRRTSSILALSLSLACAAEDGKRTEPKADASPKVEPSVEVASEPPSEPSVEPPSEPPSLREPEWVTVERITITAAEAKAAGLPAIGFSLDTTGTGMIGTRLDDRNYLHLSGPPGGPLMLIISPATIGAELADLVGGDRVLDARLVPEQVELLGAPRSAVAWITGASLARTSWCAVIVGRPEAAAGDPALLLEVGVGHQGDTVTCKTALEDHLLRPVIASLTLE